jgi:hypothetical protein
MQTARGAQLAVGDPRRDRSLVCDVGLNPELVAETANALWSETIDPILSCDSRAAVEPDWHCEIFLHYPLPQRDCALFTKAKTQFFVWGEWLS